MGFCWRIDIRHPPAYHPAQLAFWRLDEEVAADVQHPDQACDRGPDHCDDSGRMQRLE